MYLDGGEDEGSGLHDELPYPGFGRVAALDDGQAEPHVPAGLAKIISFAQCSSSFSNLVAKLHLFITATVMIGCWGMTNGSQ